MRGLHGIIVALSHDNISQQHCEHLLGVCHTFVAHINSTVFPLLVDNMFLDSDVTAIIAILTMYIILSAVIVCELCQNR